jgi:DNA-binding LacI/PurR family transcriptional regulator
MHVEHLLMVLVHLLRSGRRVPTEVSVICRETVTSLDRGLPEITRYQSATAKQARMTVRVAQSMLSGHPLKKMANLILPAFVAGETVARSQTGVPRGA